MFLGSEQLTSSNGYSQEGMVSFVVDSVFVIGHALDSMLQHALEKGQCTGEPEAKCLEKIVRNGTLLLQHIRQSSFGGLFLFTDYFKLYLPECY